MTKVDARKDFFFLKICLKHVTELDITCIIIFLEIGELATYEYLIVCSPHAKIKKNSLIKISNFQFLNMMGR